MVSGVPPAAEHLTALRFGAVADLQIQYGEVTND